MDVVHQLFLTVHDCGLHPPLAQLSHATQWSSKQMSHTEQFEPAMEESSVSEMEGSPDQEEFLKYLEEGPDFDMPSRGDLRKGVIVEVRHSEILVNVGSKRDGVVPQSDLARLDSEIVENLSVGDEIDVVVSRQSEDEGNLRDGAIAPSLCLRHSSGCCRGLFACAGPFFLRFLRAFHKPDDYAHEKEHSENAPGSEECAPNAVGKSVAVKATMPARITLHMLIPRSLSIPPMRP